MKILTLVWSIGIGGTERAAVNYAIGYKKFGEDSRVLVLGEGHERFSDLQEADVNTVLLIKSDLPVSDIFNKFRDWAPDIIHIHNFNNSFLEYIKIIKGPHTKVVDTNVFSRPNFNSNYRIVDLSMQLSNWGYWKYTRWMKYAGYCPAVAVVPYIVDTIKFSQPSAQDIDSFLKSHNIPPSAFVIGRLGQPHPSKWDKRILKVIRKTITPTNNIYYLFVGLPDDLKALICKESDFFRTRVIQIEKIEGDENLSIYYHSLHCFAHISKIGESFGYVLAEALLCKVPVVSLLTPFNDNAQFEVIGNNYGGFCVTNIKEFVKKIQLLYTNQKIRETIKYNLVGWIESRYSFDMVTPVQLDLYDQLLKNKKIQKIKTHDIINANFSLYGNKNVLIPFIAKCVNSFFFFKLNGSIKKILRR